MNKVIDFIRWLRSNFFYITIAIFVFLYIWWFRLNPPVSGPGEQATAPFHFGLILLTIYGFIIGVLKLSQHRPFLKSVSFVMAFLFLVVNVLFVNAYLPRIKASAHFGNNTYYITSNLPFFECCGYYQFTKWQSMFQYESNFYIYTMPPVRFIYDKTTDEVSLVDVSGDFETLYETFGKSNRSYEGYAKLGNHLYYASAKCDRIEKGFCEAWIYVLYQCDLDNTSCKMLPIEYTTTLDGWGDLQARESTKEIDFYFDAGIWSDAILIYTYGDSPRCFVDGCSITK